jgi:hypothetical protein
MIVAGWLLSVILVAEFIMSPINFWAGRTQNLAYFRQFTGWSDRTAKVVFAPLMSVGAVLIAVGIPWPAAAVAGTALITAVCATFLVRLAAANRRASIGIGAYVLFGACAVTLLVVQAIRLSA